MIKGKDIYEVLAAIVPLYIAMFLGYGSVRWWKIFTPEQCSGINRFVAVFAVPVLSFNFVSSNNLYNMNYRFLAADSLQKLVILFFLFLWQTFSKWGGGGRLEWTITLFSLSTLPNTLVVGIPLLKAMYGDFTSPLMIQIVVLQGVLWYTLMLIMFEYRAGKLLISEQFPDTARAISSIEVDSDVVSLRGREPLETNVTIDDEGKLHVVLSRSSTTCSTITPRVSNLSGVDLFSVQSSAVMSPRGASSDEQITDFHAMVNYSSPKHGIITNSLFRQGQYESPSREPHMFVWSSSTGGQSSDHGYLTRGGNSADHNSSIDTSRVAYPQHHTSTDNGRKTQREDPQMPATSVMIRVILIMVWRKLMRNPNTHANILGFTWSLISFRFHIVMPSIVEGSVKIVSNTGMGMAMFSLGLFMALQPRIIACGTKLAIWTMVVRFLVGPAVVAAASAAVGLPATLLHVAIVQAALPQGIVPFVFAKEYNVHAEILSTAVIFGMVLALPITIIYYVLLEL